MLQEFVKNPKTGLLELVGKPSEKCQFDSVLLENILEGIGKSNDALGRIEFALVGMDIESPEMYNLGVAINDVTRAIG